jgi:hypothetical protein
MAEWKSTPRVMRRRAWGTATRGDRRRRLCPPRGREIHAEGHAVCARACVPVSWRRPPPPSARAARAVDCGRQRPVASGAKRWTGAATGRRWHGALCTTVGRPCVWLVTSRGAWRRVRRCGSSTFVRYEKQPVVEEEAASRSFGERSTSTLDTARQASRALRTADDITLL